MTYNFEYSQGPLGDVLRTSWGRPESTSQGRPLNVRLRRPLDDISGRQIGTPRGREIGTSPGRSNRIFRGRLEDFGGRRPGDQYLPAGNIVPKSKKYFRRKTEKLCDSAVALKLLIFIRLTAERDNLVRFYGWSIHYI